MEMPPSLHQGSLLLPRYCFSADSLRRSCCVFLLLLTFACFTLHSTEKTVCSIVYSFSQRERSTNIFSIAMSLCLSCLCIRVIV